MVADGLREITLGRGRGKYVVVVMSLGVIGSNKTLHVVHEGKALCRNDEAVVVEDGVDARAVVVRARPVCEKCRARLGHVPSPKMLYAQEGAVV